MLQIRRRLLVQSAVRRGFWITLFLASLSMTVSVASAAADTVNPMLDPVLMQRLTEKAHRDGGVRVIVRLNVPNVAQLTELSRQNKVLEPGQRRSQPADRADLDLKNAIAGSAAAVTSGLKSADQRIVHTYQSIPYLALWVNETGLSALRKLPQVLDIVEDELNGISGGDDGIPVSDGASDNMGELSPENRSVDIVGASDAWAAGYTGAGWYVAMVDTGIRKTHEMFTGKTIVEACFSAEGHCPGGGTEEYGPGSSVHYPSTYTGYDHGTHVSGIAVGNSGSFFGVAKDADIVAIQVFSKFEGAACGGGFCVASYTSDQVAALDYLYTLRLTHSIAAVNFSINGASSSTSCDSDPRKAAIDNLESAGIATVVATGSTGWCGAVGAPACVSSAVAVGSSTIDDQESFFNNWHESLQDLFAPGSLIYSSIGDGDAAYEARNGTSAAAPHVAGAWALMKSKNATASVEELFNALVSTGIQVATGCGGGGTLPRIQVDAALGLLQSDTNLVIVPQTGATSGGTSVTISPPYGYSFSSLQGSGSVTFDGVEADSYTSWSNSEIVCATPPHLAGPVDLVVTVDGGQNWTLASGFTYQHAVSASAGAGGSIEPSGISLVGDGEDQTFIIAPDDCHHISDIIVDGASVGTPSSYTFNSIDTGHTIEAVFEFNSYDVVAEAGAGGGISPNGTLGIDCGSDQTFYITPAGGYSVQNVWVDGSAVGAVTEYTFHDVNTTHSIIALFTLAPKSSSSISCQVNKTGMILGEPVTISGTISPQPAQIGSPVDIALFAPGGTTVHQTVLADATGEFSYTVACGDIFEQGTWSFRTTWNGDDLYLADTSDGPDPEVEVALAETRVTLASTSQAIKLAEPVTLSGKLTPMPDCGRDLTGLPLTLTISGPDGYGGTTTTEEEVLTSDRWGHFVLPKYTGFVVLGQWTVQASFEGDDAYQSDESAELSITVVETAGYAVIVQGRISSNEGLASHNKTTNFVYRQLKERGLLDDDIAYFNYDTGQTGVDGLPAKTAVQSAITTWAMDKMNTGPANLYIILVDHGLSDVFYIYPDQITAAELDQWLDALQAGLSPQAAQQEIVTILGFCRSGSFLDNMAGANRINISSSAANESSYKGPGDVVDGQVLRDGEYFVHYFFRGVGLGDSIRDCFEEAAGLTMVYTQSQDVDSSANGPFFDRSLQHPLMDDNGDGVGSHLLGDQFGDGVYSANVFIGVSIVTGNDPGDVVVEETAPTAFLADDQDTVSLIWAKVDNNPRLMTIWVEVKSPAYTPENQGGSEQLVLDLPRTVYDGYDDGQDHYYWTNLGGFTDPGTYQVFYFAKDDITGNVSPVMETRVYKAASGNQEPGAFDLVSPADGGEVLTSVILDWDDAVDPDSDDLTYTVLISKDDAAFTSPIRLENLSVSSCLVTADNGLEDLSNYFWKVLAIDEYGAVTESTHTWTFHTNNTNPLVGYLTGRVYDDVSKNAISGAQVVVGGAGTAQTTGDGYFLIAVEPGDYNINVTASGYIGATLGSITIPEGSPLTKNFGMIPTSCAEPDAPAGLTYPASDNTGNFTVSWSAVDGVESYTLERATDSGFTTGLMEVYSGPDTAYQEVGLADGTYYYRVLAEDACGSSDWAEGSAITVVCPTPGQPATLTVPKADIDGDFTVSWSPVSGATGYVLERDTTNTFASVSTLYTGPDTIYLETGLLPGVYYYRVWAFNDCDHSDWQVSGSVLVDPDAVNSGLGPLLLLLLDDD